MSAVHLSDRQTIKAKAPTLEILIVKQTNDAYFRNAMTKVEMSGTKFHVDKNSFLVLTSKINGYIYKVGWYYSESEFSIRRIRHQSLKLR